MRELWGSALKNLRKSRGMTQDELAGKRNIPAAEIAALEKEPGAISPEDAAQLSTCPERDSDIRLPPEVLRREEQLLLHKVRSLSKREQRQAMQYLEALSRLPKDGPQK